jgi:hypothetical protein
MRLTLAAAVLALFWAAAAWADDNDWGSLAVVSSTMGVHDARLCVGEGSRGDLGCPADAPLVTGSTISGTFVGDGSGLTGVAVATDRIVSGTTTVVASQDRSVTISTAGTERLVIGQNGRIGIGTDKPQSGLHISDSRVIVSGNGGFIHLLGDTADSGVAKLAMHTSHVNVSQQYFTGIAYSNSGGSMVVGGGTALNLYLDSGGTGNYGNHIFRKVGWDGSQRTFTESMRIDRNGYVGISSTAPKTMLHVRGAIRIGTDPSDTTNACDPDRAGAIRYTSASTFDFCDGVNGWRSLQAIASAAGTDRIVSGTTSILASQDRSVTISAAGVEQVTVGENGYVGIGTSQPIAPLHVSSTALAANAPVQSWSSGTGRNIHLEQPGNNDDPWRLRTSNAIQLMVDNYPGLAVAANGHVGISTTAPSKTLTVNGDADISGTVKVAGTGDEACGPALRGTLRQNPVTRKLEICRY